MKYYIFLMLLFVPTQHWAQKIEVIETNDTLQQPKYRQFSYLSPNISLSQAVYVAKIKASGSLKNISKLYEAIKVKAQELGGNAFRFDRFIANEPQLGELTLWVYYANEAVFEVNAEALPKNKLYVFGSDNFLDTKLQSYKVQGQKQEITTGTYRTYDLTLQDELRINKGGFTGSTLFLSKQTEGYCYFLNFGGIGLAEAAINPYGGVGVAITTGSIHHVDPDLALLLLHIFKEKQ